MRIAILHRYPKDQIKQTNAAFPYLEHKGPDVLTFKKFNRLNDKVKFIKSLFWILYAPFLVIGRGYDIIYCDDSFPFYAGLVKLVCPRSKVVLRLGDFHLMYYTSGWLYRFLHFFEKITWNKVDMIIAISKVMRDHLYDEGIDNLIEVVLDPVDINDFLPANMLKDKSKRIVMFHGLLTRNKNIDILMRAAIFLDGIQICIVGDGPDKRRLESIAPSNVEFLGWKPYRWIYSSINNCDVGVALRGDNPGNEFVVTSPFLQYSTMGKPCLVSRRKVFGDYEWQFSTVWELVDKIRILLERPEEGEKMRSYVIEHHNAKKIAEEIWSLLLS